MRNSIIMVVAFATVLLASCSKTDKELLVGKWGIQNVKLEGELVASIDKKDHGKIVDNVWKEQGPMYSQMGVSKEAFKKQMGEQFKKLEKITFTFGEDGNASIDPNDGDKKAEKAKYTLDEKKKEITLTREVMGTEKKDVYKYSFKDDQLIMKQKEEELTLVRKS